MLFRSVPRLVEAPSAPPAPASTLAPLALGQLARRLSVSTQRLVARRRREDFRAWSAQLDPQRLAWRYEPSDQRFHPVAAAAVGHDAA